MTKADKARKARAERAETQQLFNFKQQTDVGGIAIQNIQFNAEMHAVLKTARALNYTVVLRPDFSGTRSWRALAVKV